MAKNQKRKTAETKKIEALLLKHFPDHPADLPPEVYRYNSASIRVRVVSSRFAKQDRVERSEWVYPILEENLPEDTWQDITMILLLTPDEMSESLTNMEFEKPTPSRL